MFNALIFVVLLGITALALTGAAILKRLITDFVSGLLCDWAYLDD